MKITTHVLLTAGILITSIGLAGCQMGNSSQSSQSSAPVAASAKSSSEPAKLAEYNGIIKTARSLNQDGQYKASNKALNQIDITDLSEKAYATIKTEYFDLQKSNDQFLLKKNAASSSSAAAKNNNGSSKQAAAPAPATNNSFSGYGKYTGHYFFYNTNDDRIQSGLNISSDGSVIQNNSDGTTFSGTAYIQPSSQGGILSYDVSSDSNDTKTITANVAIVVTWSNGEKETYYGYTGYDGSTVLTDGQSYDGDLVNEVWQKF